MTMIPAGWTRALRAAALLTGLGAAASCVDATTAPPQSRLASIAFRTRYDASAEIARASLTSFSLQINNVRIRITAPGPTLVLDTTLVFPAGVDSVSLAAKILVTATAQRFDAELALRADSTVVFTGVQAFTLAIGSAAPPPVSVPITYVGPGANAKRVVIAPRDTAVVGSRGIQYTARALDSANAVVTAAEIAWSVAGDSTLGTVSSAGLVTTRGTRGAFYVVARTLGGLRDSIRVSVAPVATGVALVSGGGQSAVVTSKVAAPVIVRVIAADGGAVPGVPVTFTARTAGATVAAGLVTTTVNSDATGQASFTPIVGSVTGTYLYEASVPGATALGISATALPGGPAAVQIASGDAQATHAGLTLPLAPTVRVIDANGNVVPGVTVAFAVTSGGGSVGSATAVTDASGLASSGAWRLGSVVGTQTMAASVGTLTATFTATAADPLSAITFLNPARLLAVGGTGTVSATPTTATGATIGSIPLTYASRDTAIVSVDPLGNITARARGQAIIVAAVKEQPGVVDSMRVLVTPANGIAIYSTLVAFTVARDTLVTVSYYVDTRNSTLAVGSATIDIGWNPAALIFQSYANGASGISPVVNANGAAAGSLRFAFTTPSGATGRIEVLRVTYKAGATPGTLGNLALSASEVSGTDFSSLLPLTQAATYQFRVR